MRRDFQGEVLVFQPLPTVKPRQTSIKIKVFKVSDDLCNQPYKRGCNNIFFIRQIVVYASLNHHCFLGCVFFPQAETFSFLPSSFADVVMEIRSKMLAGAVVEMSSTPSFPHCSVLYSKTAVQKSRKQLHYKVICGVKLIYYTGLVLFCFHKRMQKVPLIFLFLLFLLMLAPHKTALINTFPECLSPKIHVPSVIQSAA